MLEEREVIFTEDVEGIFGKRPWISRVEELMRDEQAETEGDNATSPDAVTSVSSDVETEHHDETAEQTKS